MFFEILDILYKLTFWCAIVLLGFWAVIQIKKEDIQDEAVIQIKKEDILDDLYAAEERAEGLEKELSFEKGKNEKLREENRDLLDRLIDEHEQKIVRMRQVEAMQEIKERGNGKKK